MFSEVFWQFRLFIFLVNAAALRDVEFDTTPLYSYGIARYLQLQRVIDPSHPSDTVSWLFFTKYTFNGPQESHAVNRIYNSFRRAPYYIMHYYYYYRVCIDASIWLEWRWCVLVYYNIIVAGDRQRLVLNVNPSDSQNLYRHDSVEIVHWPSRTHFVRTYYCFRTYLRSSHFENNAMFFLCYYISENVEL